MSCYFPVLVYFHSSHQASFLQQLFLPKILKVCYLPSTEQKTANIRDYLVNKSQVVPLGEIADQNRAKSSVNYYWMCICHVFCL